MPIPRTIEAYLDEHAVAYEVVHHRRDFTAQQAAADTHTPGKCFAKTVILLADNKYYMAVLCAHHHIDFAKARAVLGAQEVRLATEKEIAALGSDCEVGAMPPFGMLYDIPVYVSKHLQMSEQLTFNAGSHDDAIRMLYTDFQKLVHPRTVDITAEA